MCCVFDVGYVSSLRFLLDFAPCRWATQTGQDFTNNTNAKGVDFGGIHVWPDNWEMCANLSTVAGHCDLAQCALCVQPFQHLGFW
jgi:hypothetical protein